MSNKNQSLLTGHPSAGSKPWAKGGPGHPDPSDKGGAWSPKKFLFGLKIKVGGGLPGPLPWIRHSIHRGPLGVGTCVPNLNFKTHHFRYWGGSRVPVGILQLLLCLSNVRTTLCCKMNSTTGKYCSVAFIWPFTPKDFIQREPPCRAK